MLDCYGLRSRVEGQSIISTCNTRRRKTCLVVTERDNAGGRLRNVSICNRWGRKTVLTVTDLDRWLGWQVNVSICNRWERNGPLAVTDRDKGRSGSSCSPRAWISGHTRVENLPQEE